MNSYPPMGTIVSMHKTLSNYKLEVSLWSKQRLS